jgi:GTP-binding protein
LRIDAQFVRSAASASDLPGDGLPELAVVGRSNVGKSSLINALVRHRVARTSRAPGKTRLANVFRVARGNAAPFYLVDLPGYGYARGDRSELETVTRAYFDGTSERSAKASRSGLAVDAGARGFSRATAALLLVDARHPGLERDRQAWAWLARATAAQAVVLTKIDKLSRAERLRAIAANEAVFEHPVQPVSADTGEGLDELWKLIDRLLSNRKPQPRSNPPSRTVPAGSPQRHPLKS